MCGISWCFLQAHTVPEQCITSALKYRGPDCACSHDVPAWNGMARLAATVLHMRGADTAAQPLILSDGSLFAWNGEAFSGLPCPSDESDTLALAAKLSARLSALPSGAGLRVDPTDIQRSVLLAVRDVFSSFQGPFAFLLWHSSSQTLVFGRDPVGRRSLLLLRPTSGAGETDWLTASPVQQQEEDMMHSAQLPATAFDSFILTSTGPVDSSPVDAWACHEIEPSGVHGLCMQAPSAEPWTTRKWRLCRLPWRVASRLPPLPLLSGTALSFPAADVDPTLSLSSLALLHHLGQAVRVRVQTIAAGHTTVQQMHKSVVYDASASPATIMEALSELGVSYPSAGDRPTTPLPANATHALLRHMGQDPADACMHVHGTGASVAVLFSGGLDSMILARLAHEYTPADQPIDLINVDFSADRRSPDRLAAWAGLRALQSSCPGRVWQFICADDSLEDALQPARAERCLRLTKPRTSVMDFNIGTALWTAAQGVGFVDMIVQTSEDGRSVQAHVAVEPAATSAGDAQGATAGSAPSLRYGSARTDAGLSDKYRLSDFQVEHGRGCGGSAPPSLAHPFSGLRGACSVDELNTAIRHSVAGDAEAYKMLEVQVQRLTASHSAAVLSFNESMHLNEEQPTRPAASAPMKPSISGGGKPADRSCQALHKGKPCLGMSGGKCVRGMCKQCCVRAQQGVGQGRWDGAGVGPGDEVECPVHKPAARGTAAEVAQSAASSSASATGPPDPTAPRRVRVLIRSSARAVLVGIGADEYMAGYGRHRTAFQGNEDSVGPAGWSRLASELELDTTRLWLRNLGRDDRLVSDSGREMRSPFLDENFTAFLATLPLPFIADLRLPHGVGDKRILRGAAYLLGLTEASVLVKRAIHFGSRIAKAANVTAFGSNRKANRASGGRGGADSLSPELAACMRSVGVSESTSLAEQHGGKCEE